MNDRNSENKEKKAYEEPSVTKVEFDFKETIAASPFCGNSNDSDVPFCFD